MSSESSNSQPSQTGAVVPAENSQESTAERYTKNIQNSSVDGLAPGADVKGLPILAAKPGLGQVPPPDGDDMMRPTGKPGGSRRKKSKSSRVARKSRSTRRRKSSRRNRRRTTRK